MTYSIASTERSVSEPTPRQRSTGGKPPNSSKSDSSTSNVHSLAVLWARKYYTAVTNQDQDDSASSLAATDLKQTASLEARKSTAEKMMQKLNFASAQAWSLTETLLSEEIRRHGINPELVNPLEIAADTRYLFQKTANAYAQRATPRRLSVIVGKDFGQVRQKYTSVDRRAIGFVSMQFHYTGQKILDWLSPAEQKLWLPYLKVMDDHMYMPLQAAYDAAANHPYNSPALLAVQNLLPISTKLAISVCQQVCRQNPNYETYSGSLMSKTVRIASVRDVEMFQVYLCLCVLEDDIRAVQRELFPLCVMLYPRLRVGWRLVQDMLKAIGWEMYNRLSPENMATFLPYLRTLTEMFSCDVFQEPE